MHTMVNPVSRHAEKVPTTVAMAPQNVNRCLFVLSLPGDDAHATHVQRRMLVKMPEKQPTLKQQKAWNNSAWAFADRERVSGLSWSDSKPLRKVPSIVQIKTN